MCERFPKIQPRHSFDGVDVGFNIHGPEFGGHTGIAVIFGRAFRILCGKRVLLLKPLLQSGIKTDNRAQRNLTVSGIFR